MSQDMQLLFLDRLEAFEDARPHWERAHQRDPCATVFLSWPWMRGWFEDPPYPWAVITGLMDGEPVAFWPVSLRGSTSPLRLDQVREIHMGGAPGADYSGIVCAPEHVDSFLASLRALLTRDLQWDRLRLKDVLDERLDRLARMLKQDGWTIEERGGQCCPFVQLPASWEAYEHEHLTADTRKSIRRSLRAVENECRVEHLTPANADRLIETLLALAAMRRGEQPDLPQARNVFRFCAQAGLLDIVTLWRGDEPVAGQASFIDRKHGALCVYMSGFDERFAAMSPGKALDAICIRKAIEHQGLRIVDFLRGDERYKFSFGAMSRYTTHTVVVHPGLNTATRIIVNRVRETLRL